MGMVSRDIRSTAGKPIFGYMAMVGSLFAICILAFLVCAPYVCNWFESISWFGIRVAGRC